MNKKNNLDSINIQLQKYADKTLYPGLTAKQARRANQLTRVRNRLMTNVKS